MAWLIVTKDGQPWPSANYPAVVQDEGEGRYVSWSGNLGVSGTLLPGFAVRPPRNASERRAIERAAAEHDEAADQYRLRRWARRDGLTVEWGNTVAGMQGQAFRQTFATEADAIERERQALANEDISSDRQPIAVTTETLHP